MKITLIDDDRIVLFIHSKLLKKENNNIQIETYTCPEEFVKKLETGEALVPDVIISDYNMGNTNGVLLLKRVENLKKNNPELEGKLNFYLASSDINIDRIAENCTSSIFKGYFRKPLNNQDISGLFNKHKIAS